MDRLAKNIDWKSLQDFQNVIIFGAGAAGQGVMKLLRSNGVKVFCFHDNGAVAPYSLQGVPVSRLDLSTIDPKSNIFVLAIHDMDEAIRQLEKVGGCSWVPAYDLLNGDSQADLSFFERQKIEAIYFYYEHYIKQKGRALNSLDFVITERCSLRCRECSNLMQYYKHPRHYDSDALKRQLDRVDEVFDEIYELRLIGGEPLVHPSWPEILQYASSKAKIHRISIYTNGTVLPTEAQCEILKASNAWLSISDYGELSRNLKALIERMERYSIPYECKAVPFWTRCSSFVKHERAAQELTEVFQRCCARNLATLLDGKLYPCPFIANALNLRAIPLCKADRVDLMKDTAIQDMRKGIKELFQVPYFQSCAWCEGRPTPEDIREEDKIPPHEQIQDPRSYVKFEGE